MPHFRIIMSVLFFLFWANIAVAQVAETSASPSPETYTLGTDGACVLDSASNVLGSFGLPLSRSDYESAQSYLQSRQCFNPNGYFKTGEKRCMRELVHIIRDFFISGGVPNPCITISGPYINPRSRGLGPLMFAGVDSTTLAGGKAIVGVSGEQGGHAIAVTGQLQATNKGILVTGVDGNRSGPLLVTNDGEIMSPRSGSSDTAEIDLVISILLSPSPIFGC